MKLPWANKELGQHFLINQEVIDRITSDYIDQCQSIIEVGPGPGILTQFLKTKNTNNCDLWVIEKDQRFIEYISDHVAKNKTIFTDALQFDLSSITSKKTWLVSNLPYNISAPLTIKFIQESNIQFMTLMYQKEVGEKLAPPSGKKNTMSSFLALAQTYFKCERLCYVAPDSFTPPPKVHSIVISFNRIENPNIALEHFCEFEKFLRKFFAQRRKQIKKVMKAHMSLERLEDILSRLSKAGTERSETFTLDEVQFFFKLFKEDNGY